MKENDVDVVIVNYNAGDILLECVKKIIKNIPNLIIIVDNNSSDSSLGLCEQQLSGIQNIRIIKNSKNIGFAAACNVGMLETKGDAVLFLNPDCLIEPNVIELLYQVLTSDKSVGMVGGMLLNVDGSEQAGGRRAVPTPWRSFVRAFGLARFSQRWPRLFCDFNLCKQPLPKQQIEVEALSGACIMVKRKAVEEIGLWDEGYFLHCEDIDWCMRFRKKQWKVMFVPSAKIIHIHGACSKNNKIFVEWHKHKGMMRFYRKFFRHQYPGALMWLVAVGVWLRFGVVSSAIYAKQILKRIGFSRD
ncbi:MAG: glycosyltransferase family 2 protein [Candidatus Thiodiazotropha sp. (ex Myrtea sp. 'scaly one' KF741663)]|nr:glycosyltransferase family 2 protein [Candidatus Thiodiazotropha sp. (ex Myrtea sp. 'scaly one' KF741663)]